MNFQSGEERGVCSRVDLGQFVEAGVDILKLYIDIIGGNLDIAHELYGVTKNNPASNQYNEKHTA